MKTAITADVQARPYGAFATNEGGINSRLQIIAAVLKYAVDRAEGGVLAINGDLHDNRRALTIDTIDVVAGVIRKGAEGLEAIILNVGNHDQFLKNGAITSVRWLALADNVYVPPQEGGTYDVGNVRYHVLPYQTDLDVVEKFCATTKIKDGAWNLLFIHQGIGDAIMSGGQLSKSSLTVKHLHADRFTYVYVGDYHRPQQLAPNVAYVGSPCQHNFGEMGETKRIMVFDSKDGSTKSFNTNAPEFRRITFEEWSVLDHSIRDYDYFEVLVRQEHAAEVDHPHARPVLIRGESSKQSESISEFNVRTSIRSYLEEKSPGRDDLQQIAFKRMKL